MLVTDEDLMGEMGNDDADALCEMPALVDPDRYQEVEPDKNREVIIAEDDDRGESSRSAPAEELEATIPFERAEDFKLADDDSGFRFADSELKFDEMPSEARAGDDVDMAGYIPFEEEPKRSPLDQSGSEVAEFDLDMPSGDSDGLSADEIGGRSGASATDEPDAELEFETELDTDDADRTDAGPRVIQIEDDGELRFDAGEADTELESPEFEVAEATGRRGEETFDEVSFEQPELDQPNFKFDQKKAANRPTPSSASPINETKAPRLKGKPTKARESSPLATATGYFLSAVIGLSLGYLVLLWCFPVPETDVLHIAGILPGWMVPAQLHTPSTSNPVSMADLSSSPPAKGDVEKQLNAPGSAFAEVDPKTAPAPQDNSGVVNPAPSEAAVPVAPTEPDTSVATPVQPPTQPTAEQEPAQTPVPGPPTGSSPATAPSTIASTVKKPAIEETEPVTPNSSEDPQSPPTASKVGPRGAPQFSAADVKKALADVRQLSTTASPASDKRKAKLQFYMKLYNLAAALTLSQRGEPGDELAATTSDAQNLVLKLAADEDRNKEMTYVAMQWLSRPAAKRGEHQGVVLIGKVQQVTPRGPVDEIGLQPEGWPHTVNIVTADHMSLSPQTSVIVVGTIIDDPARSLEGYQGTAKQVVWTGMVLPAGK